MLRPEAPPSDPQAHQGEGRWTCSRAYRGRIPAGHGVIGRPANHSGNPFGNPLGVTGPITTDAPGTENPARTGGSPLDRIGRTALVELSRWRHGFESRWGCSSKEFERRHFEPGQRRNDPWIGRRGAADRGGRVTQSLGAASSVSRSTPRRAAFRIASVDLGLSAARFLGGVADSGASTWLNERRETPDSNSLRTKLMRRYSCTVGM